MSISQKKSEETTAGHLFCPQCNATLPLRATFCSFCGERLKRKKQATVLDEQDINSRYRITTLVRRRPHSNLYFAVDKYQPQGTGQLRMVAIRDIEIVHLDKEARAQAITLAQQEYDRLRRWHLPHVLASTDLRLFQEHLFLVSRIPLLSQEAATGKSAQRLYTLQDFLQSGQGLPQEARTLAWIRNLCQAVERLHRHQIILSDLDPSAVVLNKNSVDAEPKLIVSWVLPELQKLLVQPAAPFAPQVSYFCAPEALAGKPEVRSDVYSLGALLYLLLTGTAPDESTLRHRRRLRGPREINMRISQRVDECVMQALSLEPTGRFASVAALLTALEDARLHLVPHKAPGQAIEPSEVEPADAETVRIVPLSQKNVARWRTAREELSTLNTQIIPSHVRAQIPTLAAQNRRDAAESREKARGHDSFPVTPLPTEETHTLASPADSRPASGNRDTPPPMPAPQRPDWKKRITGILTTPRPESDHTEITPKKAGKTKRTDKVVKPRSTVAPKAKGPVNDSEASFLKQIQRLLVGKQQHTVEAAAIIETPLRIRPDQSYHLRLHIVGRDEPVLPPKASKGQQPAGLSALVHGEAIQLEVRSVLQQGYTYMLQRATVTVPAEGYAAEVTIPMQPQAGGPNGRRDRLHVFFLDDKRYPLYERPFVVEIFVSPLVQLGREGHQVLTIPI